MNDQQLIDRMDEILATSEDPRERHMAHRAAHYAHRRLMESRIYNNTRSEQNEPTGNASKTSLHC